MAAASRSLASALWGARFASGLLHPTYTTSRDTTNRGPKVKHSCPAADPLFFSAAASHRERVAGIVLSG
jgi:chemotaxis response regulator CheB